MIDLFAIKGVRAAHPCVFSMILVLMILMTAFGMHLVSDECMDGFSRRQSHTVSPFRNRCLHLQVIAVICQESRKTDSGTKMQGLTARVINDYSS